MSFQLEFDTTATHARLAGELTIYSVAEIRQRYAAEMLEKCPDCCEIDLAEVSEIDTAGLQLMLLAKRKPGKTVGFCKHPEVVLRLIDLANLAQTLDDLLVMQAPQSA